MKIDVITYSRTRNYGGILQAYGLYKYLEIQNYEVCFIDYIPRRCNINDSKVFVEEITSKSKFWGINLITKWLFTLLRYPKIKKSFAPFLNFMNEKACFTHPYFTESELENDIPEADVYITGSDQVWNSQFASEGTIDLPFYLPFVKNGRKISYASSFGANTVPEKHKVIIKELISKYDFISVREYTGKDILNELNIKSKVVVDPTILCPVKVWDGLANNRISSNYILLYQVVFNNDMYLTAKSIAKEINKKLICITLDDKDKKCVLDNLIVAPSIEDWLSYIRFADCVITDSFHACVFSILFKINFVVNSATRKGMSSRITNLLDSVELSFKDVCSFDTEEILKHIRIDVDWNSCHHHLNELRNDSEKWLLQAIENNA